MPSFWSLFGSEAESATCRWLESSGFRIVDRNWMRPWGELDIVAVKAGVVHFVEVKASKVRREGFEPFVRANRSKMVKVARTARSWLIANNYGPETEWQLDLVSVIMNPEGPEFELFDNV